MFKTIVNYFETILAGLLELAPVYVCVKENEYNR